MYRLIEVISSKGHGDTIKAITERFGATIVQLADVQGDVEVSRVLADGEGLQELIDALQTALRTDANWQLIIMPVEAALPKRTAEGETTAPAMETREELYTDMVAAAEGGRNFLLLAVLSTVVASIGLVEDNVAVVIGAMVIAPLLGPNLAFAFAVAMGDRPLMVRCIRTSALGVAATLAVCIPIGLLWTGTLGSGELQARTAVGLDSVALAVASGLAAALSLTTGLSTSLVGVMVAVALLPPAATLGIMAGAGAYRHALGAAMLLVTNITAIILTAQVMFIVQGIGPRTWWEKRRAKASLKLNLWVLSTIMVVMIGLIELAKYL
ncbi:MAG: TIGR00341 family protein [Alphaproteobacteria bacterium]|nr:TIGR00341 family protein [Alphaproteobacteria bacterium]